MSINTVDVVSAETVAAMAESGGGILVDTLPPEHYAARHIPGAVNACVYEMNFLDAMAELVPDKTTSIICYGAGAGSRDSIAAADKLVRAGYSDVAIFTGGLEEWRESNLALEGERPGEVDPPHPMLALDAKVYSLLPEESVIRWTGRNNNGGHNGTLRFAAGEFDGAELAGAFSMDMASIANEDLAGNELQSVLEAHLKSDDFFFISLFPKATFTTTKVRLVEEGEATRPNAMLQGVLSLRGVENEIAFPAHIRNLEDGRITIMGNLDFDRTQWDILYGSSRFFQYLSYHVVFDFISVEFRMVLA